MLLPLIVLLLYSFYKTMSLIHASLPCPLHMSCRFPYYTRLIYLHLTPLISSIQKNFFIIYSSTSHCVIFQLNYSIYFILLRISLPDKLKQFSENQNLHATMIVNNDVRKCVLMKESIELLKSLTDVKWHCWL